MVAVFKKKGISLILLSALIAISLLLVTVTPVSASSKQATVPKVTTSIQGFPKGANNGDVYNGDEKQQNSGNAGNNEGYNQDNSSHSGDDYGNSMKNLGNSIGVQNNVQVSTQVNTRVYAPVNVKVNVNASPHHR